MDYSQSFAISGAGMTAERTRVDVAAMNLANANTLQMPDGVHYQPMRVNIRSQAISAMIPEPFAEQVSGGLSAANAPLLALPTATVEPANLPANQVYDPGNPFSDALGFVAYPGVDTATEMVTMMSAMRAYEANVVAMNTAKTMALKALDIGGGA